MDSLNLPTPAFENPTPSHTLSPAECRRSRHYFDLLRQWYRNNSHSSTDLKNSNTKPLSSPDETLKKHAAIKLAELGLLETKMVGNVIKFEIPKGSTVEDIRRMLQIIAEYTTDENQEMLSSLDLHEKAEQVFSLISSC